MIALALARIAPLFLIAVAPVPPAPTFQETAAYHIVLSRASVGAGQDLELRLVPTPPPGALIHWGFGPSGLPSTARIPTVGYRVAGKTISSPVATYPSDPATFLYHAPYVVAPGAPPVRVQVMIASAESPRTGTSVRADIPLIPGSLARADDCLGPGQAFSRELAGFDPPFATVDELPELVSRPASLYPHSQVVRGVTDTLAVLALVCRSGLVLDAHVLQTFRRIDPGHFEPILHDPTLIRMAEDTVRQYVFHPASFKGEALAVNLVIFVDLP